MACESNAVHPSFDRHNKNQIIVNITPTHIYIGNKKIDSLLLDSVLAAEIEKQFAHNDTPTVSINADSLAFYRDVFRVMKIAKARHARVVALVK